MPLLRTREGQEDGLPTEGREVIINPRDFRNQRYLGSVVLITSERAIAFLVVLNIAPTSSMPWEVATDSVGFKKMVGIAWVGLVVMVLGCAPGTIIADKKSVPAGLIDCGLEDALWDIFEARATANSPELLLR